MKTFAPFVILWMISFHSFSQNAEITVYQQWVYLDNNWNKVTDTSDYSFKRLTTVDGKTNIHPMGGYGRKNYSLILTSENTGNYSKILNGTYTWYNKKGQKKSEHIFSNGELKSTKEFRKNGKVKTQFKYDSFPNEKGIAFYIYEYNKDMTLLRVSDVKKDEHGKWPVMRD